MAKTPPKAFEYIEPIGARVLVRKDDPKRQTKGGIALPDQAEIPTITGRIVTISAQVENDPDIPLRQYDKILFHPKNAIPVDFEPDNQLFVVPAEDVVAVDRQLIADGGTGASRQPDGSIDTGLLATIRTGVLAIAALVVAWIGRHAGFREWSWLVYPLLVGIGFKMAVQDFMHSRPVTLFVALALYGAALIVAPRMRRRQA